MQAAPKLVEGRQKNLLRFSKVRICSLAFRLVVAVEKLNH